MYTIELRGQRVAYPTLAVGRIRKLAMDDEFISAFTVGDQLLWGAAEPLRRVLRIILGNLD